MREKISLDLDLVDRLLALVDLDLYPFPYHHMTNNFPSRI